MNSTSDSVQPGAEPAEAMTADAEAADLVAQAEAVEAEDAASVDAAGRLLGTGGVEVGDRGDADAGDAGEGGEVLTRDDPEPDDAYAVRAAHSIPLSTMVRTFGSARTSGECPGVATKMRPSPQWRVHTAGDVTGRCHGW